MIKVHYFSQYGHIDGKVYSMESIVDGMKSKSFFQSAPLASQLDLYAF
jgi:hypothetical protein